MKKETMKQMDIKKEEWIEMSEKYLMTTYKRFPVVIERGLGVHLWDCNGRSYLDLVGGIAVCALGHSHPRVVAAIREQVENLTHISNYYHIEPQILLGALLVESTPLDKVFFCNSGAEANEAAIKLARRYASENMQGKNGIITMRNSFHGRTLATVTATGQENLQVGYAPLPTGFSYVPFNDLPALEAAITEETCAVLVEPIQGEAGIVVPDQGYLQGIRRICDERGILMIADEIQSGMGRTGMLFACEHEDVVPDLMTVAKALGNGFPIGALLAKEHIAASFVPGSHGSTFGGNPLACAAGLAALQTILEEGVIDNSREVGDYFLTRLEELKKKHPAILTVRGKGLMIGVSMDAPCAPLVLKCMEKGLLINCTNTSILRFVPPLILTKIDVDKAIQILDEALGET